MDASERRKRAAQEAAEWWVKLQGEVPRSEREQYVDWLRESSVHVAEMLRVAQVHGALAQFERWSQLPPEDGGTDTSSTETATVISLPTGDAPTSAPVGSSPRPPNRRRRRPLFVLATAASLLVVVGIAAHWLMATRGQVIETQRGERRQVALADGSVVQIDPETRIRVDYQADYRRVYLEHGRALFHVAKNAHRPFWVQADETTVRAVGTAFAVEEAHDAVVVTVAEGKVAVMPVHPRSADAAEKPAVMPGTAAPKNTLAVVTVHGSTDSATRAAGTAIPAAALSSGFANGEIFLTANEQVTVAGSGTAEPVREVDSRRELAWAEGRLIFESESVDRAVREFNRYNRIQITVNDTELSHRPISGVFSASDPESFVAFIQSVAPVHVTRNAAADIAINRAN
jgi:transmembrane sensor